MSQYNETIEEKIDRAVMDSLRGITDGNYPFTATVRWKNRQGNEIEPTKLALIAGDARLLNAGSWGHDHYEKDYTIFAPVVVAENDAENESPRASNYSGAIIRAFMLDPQFGNLALNAFYDGTAKDDDGINVSFRVHFRTLKDDPFNE